MKLPFFIARRYLFAKKSHNVINIVSAISCAGMAVGTAALIIILSVYNGFDALVKGMFSSVEPDLSIIPASGKYFTAEGPAFDWAYDNADVKSMCSVVQDNVFVSYEDKQGTVLLRGVDDIYLEESGLEAYVSDGELELSRGDRRFAAVGRGFARSMGINVHFLSPMELYYPSRDARVSVINPMSALNSRRIWPRCEIAVNPDIDNNLLLVERGLAQSLLGVGDKVSAVEIRCDASIGKRQLRRLKKGLREQLGPDFKVLDRAEQNPSLYRMLRYEKLAVYMIMVFVVLVLGFSIFGCMRMLIIDKRQDMMVLDSMGMTAKDVRRIFILDGWFISLLGMAAGLAFGVVFCLLQQHFGFMKMPGNFIVESYPMILSVKDLIISCASIALSGYIIARLSTFS